MAIATVASARQSKSCVREARILFAVAFIYFLVVATISRLIPRAWRPDIMHAHEGKSVFGEASEAATSVVGFAFMR